QNPFLLAEAFAERALNGVCYRFRIDNSAEAVLLGVLRHRRDAVIGGQRDDDPVEADLPVEIIEKLGSVRSVRSVMSCTSWLHGPYWCPIRSFDEKLKVSKSVVSSAPSCSPSIAALAKSTR